MIPHVSPGAPFSLGFGPAVDAMLGLGTLQRLYETLPPGNFVERALERLDIRVSAHDIARLPQAGPAIVVANHPTGALDGLSLLAALFERRRDVRVLGNHVLARIPEMREWTIPIDPYRSGAAVTLAGLRAARRWVEQGGVLAVFPAGAVARACHDGLAEDEPWQDGVLALTRWTSAPIVPAHISGRPSMWFRALGRVHAAVSTALLPRELLKQRGTTVSVRFGTGVSASRFAEMPRATGLPYLRARVMALAGAAPAAEHGEPVAPGVTPSIIAREIDALPSSCRMAESRHLVAYCADASRIPGTLREIGRLREITFREAGEGTGRSIDLDEFDCDYLHLFLWDTVRKEIAGAYRMAPVDDATHRRLYTETLFEWRQRPGALFGPCLELGRSFIRREYQREPAALLLLWKGIGTFVARHPRYQRLFGPVSISADYSAVSRELIAGWLRRDAAAPAIGEVRGPNELWPRREVRALLESGAVAGVQALDELVRELEGTRGVPILLRQYLRLNGRVLAVSRDPAFNDATDALLVVDLRETPMSHLERYCGVDGARRIRGRGVDEESSCEPAA